VAITYDPDKSERNIRERGIPFDRAADFEWSGALAVEDKRTFISLRKANKREVNRYEAKKAHS
jgi:uncharacterized DUF497 family protein